MMAEIASYLLMQGFSPQYAGFHNLCQTLEYTVTNPEAVHSIMAVYAEVARRTGTRPECIEHNIRYLIESWYITNGDLHRPKPQNKMVISVLTPHLVMGRREKITFT